MMPCAVPIDSHVVKSFNGRRNRAFLRGARLADGPRGLIPLQVSNHTQQMFIRCSVVGVRPLHPASDPTEPTIEVK